jgi:hypothetical protein
MNECDLHGTFEQGKCPTCGCPPSTHLDALYERKAYLLKVADEIIVELAEINKKISSLLV